MEAILSSIKNLPHVKNQPLSFYTNLINEDNDLIDQASLATLAAANPDADCIAAARRRPNSALNIHVKNVGRINTDALHALETATPESARRFAHSDLWRTDASKYDHVPRLQKHQIPITVFSSENVRIMLKHGVIKEIKDPQGPVILFPVEEPNKMDMFGNMGRLRPIRHTNLINEYCGRETLSFSNMATKRDILLFPRRGLWAAQFDFSAYFDQILLNEEVGRRMCFRKGRRFYQVTTVPMGQRHSVEIAQNATNKMLDFPDRECESAAIIDNVIIYGESREAVIRDCGRFLARVKQVGGTLNEIDVNTATVEDIGTHVKQQLEWGGIVLDFDAKRTQLTQKHVDKLRLSWANRESWTFRDVAVHFGLLFWAIGIVEVNPAVYFRALHFYAHMSRAFALLESDKVKGNWDAPATASIWPEAFSSIKDFTDRVIANDPRSAAAPAESEPDWLVSVDSCRRGWGYLAVCPRTGEIRTHGACWDRRFVRQNRDKLHRSVFTEPHGTVRAMCHLLTKSDAHQRVRIWTDSVTTMVAGIKGFNSRSEDVNSCMLRLYNFFPREHYSFEFGFIPGKKNIVADAQSRGLRVSWADLEGGAAQLHELNSK